jgi:hypothetical protein
MQQQKHRMEEEKMIIEKIRAGILNLITENKFYFILN